MRASASSASTIFARSGRGSRSSTEIIADSASAADGVGGPLSARSEAHVGLPRVLGALLPRDEADPLEARQVAARGRGIDAEERGEERGRHGSVLGDELEGLGLLRRHVPRARALAADATETSSDDLCCASESLLVGGHLGRAVLYKFALRVKPAVRV